jgi:hypothetical protein
MAPNFKINNPFDFVLTMPFASHLVPLLLGRERQWTPENDAAARFWTSRYAIQAVIEMQKVVDWFRSQPTRQWQTPMAMMIMDRDPTVSAKAGKKRSSPDGSHLIKRTYLLPLSLIALRMSLWVISQGRNAPNR